MTDQRIAIALKDAPEYVPFSEDYLRRAVKRTGGNVLKARFAARKYVVTLKDLSDWVEHEGADA